MKRNESATEKPRTAGFQPRIAGQVALDILFPRQCPVCRDWVETAGESLCGPCGEVARIERTGLFCPNCAGSVGPFEVVDGRCRACWADRTRVDGAVRVASFRGSNGELTSVGSLLRRFKFQGEHQLASVLGLWMAQAVDAAHWRPHIDAIQVVPTHWRHRIGRSIYPAEVLAAEVARRAGIRRARFLRRVRGGPHQIGLSHTARQENVRGAFALRRRAKVDGARLLLIDDVKTTGATLAECAKVLRQGGAAEIYAAVLVKVPYSGPTGQPITSI